MRIWPNWKVDVSDGASFFMRSILPPSFLILLVFVVGKCRSFFSPPLPIGAEEGGVATVCAHLKQGANPLEYLEYYEHPHRNSLPVRRQKDQWYCYEFLHADPLRFMLFNPHPDVDRFTVTYLITGDSGKRRLDTKDLKMKNGFYELALVPHETDPIIVSSPRSSSDPVLLPAEAQ